MQEKKLRPGFTTGSAATAAALAAALTALNGMEYEKVTITTPLGTPLHIPVQFKGVADGLVTYSVIKDGGDDPDVTNGCEIQAAVALTTDERITIKGGKGVGIVTKPGLSTPVGEPAINPVPRQMIIDSVKKCLPPDKGAIITISVPLGESIAKKTLNSHLGIVGGISILGTTGIVYPMSEEAYKTSLTPQLDVIKALGYETLVLTPGRIGQRCAEQFGFSGEYICLTSNYLGYMLEQAVEKGFRKLILAGHPGKLVKLAAGVFHTHNRMGDGRLEAMAAAAAVLDAPAALVKDIFYSLTTEAAIQLIDQWEKRDEFWTLLAHRAIEKVGKYLFQEASVSLIFFNYQGQVLGSADPGNLIGGLLNE